MQRYSRLVRGAIVLLAGLAFTASANAAPPAVTATATPAAGVAPFRVTLAATGDAATYSWTLGDGATAAGPVVAHVYGGEIRRNCDRHERCGRGLAGTGGRDGLPANADAGSADARRLWRRHGARRAPCDPRSGAPVSRSTAVEPTSPRRGLARMAAFGRDCSSALARAVPRPLRSGAIDRASRAPPPDDRSATARDRRRRLDLDTAPAARTNASRVALRPRLPRRPPHPRPPRSREASDRQAGHPAGGAGLQAARRLRARPQGGLDAGRAPFAGSRARAARASSRSSDGCRSSTTRCAASTASTEPTRSRRCSRSRR